MARGDACRLRPVEESDLDTLLYWRNSERIRRNMYTDHLITPGEHRVWYERIRNNPESSHRIFECGGRPAGLVYFQGIDRVNGRCQWGFYLGETSLPRGTGHRMGCLALEYAFRDLGIRKLCGEVLGFNEASQRFFRRLGFVEEGRLVRHVLKGGDFADVVLFALFRDDWERNLPSGTVPGHPGKEN